MEEKDRNVPWLPWSHLTLCSWWEKMSYPDAVFLLVLLPVASCVAEHQAVARHPVRAAVSSRVATAVISTLLPRSIWSHCWALESAGDQPPVPRTASERERAVATSHRAATFTSQREKQKKTQKKYSVQLKPLYNPKPCPTSLHKPLVL